MKLLNLPEESLSRINMERYCWFDREFIKCLEQDNYSMEVINYYRDYFKIIDSVMDQIMIWKFNE